MNNFIVGSGGHAKVCVELLKKRVVPISGYISNEKNNDFYSLPYMGSDEKFLLSEQKGKIVIGIGMLRPNDIRYHLFEKYVTSGLQILTIVHPNSMQAIGTTLGMGCQIFCGSIIQTGSSIGINSIINTGVIVDHDCLIGDHCHLAPGVTLSGGVKVGDHCFIGTGAKIIHGVKIGEGSLIAAGAVIYKDVPPGSIVKSAPMVIKSMI